MVQMALGFVLFFAFLQLLQNIHAQNISTTATIPPLQWINITGLLQGSTQPPPLKDAAIGYDETSRSLIVFGGVSESGFPQSQTFLLNLQTLTWSTPSPPANLQRSPPARSAAVYGCDFAASNRQGFVVIGGKGADGKALSDVWEYDFNNQFWSEVNMSPGGPSARWGASGGIDIRTPPNQDPVVPGPNNTFYIAGGFDGTSVNSLSDVWRLNISGTLSSNLPNSVSGSWNHLSIGNLPSRLEQAGTVISSQIIATGGCDSSSSLTAVNATCAKQDSFVIEVQRQAAIFPGSCPAPRVGATLVPNLNGFSTAFASQTFLLLGNFDSSLWEDSDGLAQGEVAILDINTGTWVRVLPSGDPGSSGSVTFPTPREGAAGFSFSQALVGNSRNNSADTIIFGGQDANGNFLSELWLLRAYTGAITPSNPNWTGFGNGQLQTGINADGSGVLAKYLTQCASLIPNTSPSNNGSAPGAPEHGNSDNFETSILHKLLLPLSLVVSLPVLLFFRWAHPTSDGKWMPIQHVGLVAVAAVIGVAAYLVGVVGLIFSFTTISSRVSTQNIHLKTAHGIAGLTFFLCLYVLTPLLYLIVACFNLHSRASSETNSQRNFNGAARALDEKIDSDNSLSRSVSPSMHNTSPPSSPPVRTQSFDAPNLLMLRPSNDGDMSGDSSAPTSPHKGFEVLNRPNRARDLSEATPSTPMPGSHHLLAIRRLGDIDWLLRRRSLNAVGELDYAITQTHNAQHFANATAETASPSAINPSIQYSTVVLHTLVQICILGLSALTLVALWTRAPHYLFIIFLLWIMAYYVAMIALAWNGYPASSLLTAALWGLRSRAHTAHMLDPLNTDPRNTQGPYAHHRPPFRASIHPDDLSYPHGRPLGVEMDDDLDDDTRQRLMEEEMERRDVSIITVPRRKLWVANPS